MKHSLLLATIVLQCCTMFAQKVTVSHDTIYNGSRPIALVAEKRQLPQRYLISSLGGTPLIRISDGRTEQEGTPAFVVTFVSDKKKAMVPSKNAPDDIIAQIQSYQVITRMSRIDQLSENIFIKNHPLPEGFTDIDRPMEPGVRIRVPKK